MVAVVAVPFSTFGAVNIGFSAALRANYVLFAYLVAHFGHLNAQSKQWGFSHAGHTNAALLVHFEHFSVCSSISYPIFLRLSFLF